MNTNAILGVLMRLEMICNINPRNTHKIGVLLVHLHVLECQFLKWFWKSYLMFFSTQSIAMRIKFLCT